MLKLTLLFSFSVGLSQLCFAEQRPLIGAADWLNAQPVPRFRANDTLPPLTRYGWTLPVEARRVLAEKWGYALEFSSYVSADVVHQALTDTQSPEGQVLNLAVRQPEIYKLSIILPRDMPSYDVPGAWVRKGDGHMPDEKRPTWSPAPSETALRLLVERRVLPIGPLVDIVKPAIVLNGGEYGIGVLGQDLPQWQQDPNVLAAKGPRDWFDFISDMKAKEQLTIRQAVQERVGADFLYVYYTNGSNHHRQRYGGWRDWAFDYKYMRKIGSLPSNEYYYRSLNDGWTRISPIGDLLTQALNAKGFEIAGGDPISYDWVTAGWHRNDDEIYVKEGSSQSPNLSRIDIYTGFLKCIYLAGTVGANAGYYAYPNGGFSAKFAPDTPPHWLVQLAALSYVHALFSHLEPFVKQSALLPGPNRHVWTDNPAYEFPTGDGNLRSLVRKHDSAPAWLLIAWSATGASQAGEVDIPGRGRVVVSGTASGKLWLLYADRPAEEITEATVEAIASKYPELF